MSRLIMNRRSLLRSGVALGAAGLATPTFFANNAWAQDNYLNAPQGDTVTLGFNVPQTGAYADEGADELRAYQLAVKHLNGEGDGGMLDDLHAKALKGNGILGKKVAFVTGDTQTKADAARASRQADDREGRRDHDHRRLVLGRGGRGAGALPGDGRHLHGRPHPLQRHHRQGQTALRLPPLLQRLHVGRRRWRRCSAKDYGKDRIAYHLTADYTWGWTQEESIKNARPRRWAGRRCQASARRSAPATSRSTSRRC